MSYSKLKKLAQAFDNDMVNAFEWATNQNIRANNIIVMPIPILPKAGVIEFPDDIKVSELPRFFDRHPEQAIIIAVGSFLAEYELVDGHVVPVKESNYKKNHVVTMAMNRYVHPVIHKGTTMYSVKPSDIISISKSQFKKEDYEFEISK